ncbi:TetR/AcrR family transcriptional regulator [Rhodococcus sp. P1Y]|uniref:TetR/AcrR family transcriptional regulator n=1 Tax=Rhodococcus sp. P1Y TaxID=1302308 RepID=UPI000EB14EC0|nr:TetR/AcrR family transcriptional regulator [Rhodococcus sp. P1Y]AYJ47553.1 TetR/AcrR family transcriptional regulator [Rhodococcus sp. P1Y]
MADKRSYHSPAREGAALLTRHAVVDAAAELFETQGYGGTTMRSIAKRAGVSVETVNALGPKVQLLRSAFERRFLPSSPDGRMTAGSVPEVDVSDSASVRQVLGPLIRQFERSAGMHRALGAAADIDAAARRLVDDLRDAQRQQIYGLIDRQFGKTSTTEAKLKVADALAYTLSHGAYDHFVRACGWSSVEYEAWAADTVVEHLRTL